MSLQLILKIIIFIWIASEAWIFARDIGKANAEKDRNTRLYVVLLMALGFTIAIWIEKRTNISILQNSNLTLSIGMLLILAGILLRHWAVRTLGKYFRTHVQIQKGHKVIQTGPYKYIRHPSYTGGLLSILGFAISLNNWLSLIILIVFAIAALYQRIIVEEKVLAKDLGKEYQEYQKNTKKLIPFIF